MDVSQAIFNIYSYIINQLDGLSSLLLLFFVVKYANIFYLSCKDLSDRIWKFMLTVFFSTYVIPEAGYFFILFVPHRMKTSLYQSATNVMSKSMSFPKMLAAPGEA